jgi:hypothetical protein
MVLSGVKTQTRRIHKRGWVIGHTYKIKDTYYCKGLGTMYRKRALKIELNLCRPGLRLIRAPGTQTS